MPQCDLYDWSGDPGEDVYQFQTNMLLLQVSDVVMCRAFPTALRKAAHAWFKSLRPRSIHSFAQLSDLFQKYFVSSRTRRKNSASLINVVQERNESLSHYLGCFNAATLEIDNLDESVKYTAFLRGLHPTSKFAFAVNKSPSGNMSALLNKANKSRRAPKNAGVINTISGGVTAGGSSGQGQKAYAREVLTTMGPLAKRKKMEPAQVISFSDEDVGDTKTPYDDPLAIRKAKDFAWTEECQKSFEELKCYLSSPPLLTKPVTGEDLFLYLSISEVAVSTVLIREEEGKQRPIYYMSKVLQDVETRYPRIDKVALSLVISVRKLRPYFQSHTIVMLTDQPLGKVPQNPDTSGRLVNWLEELGEFDIKYKPRAAIKAQALSDFVIECTAEKTEASKFKNFAIRHIPRDQNTQADSLSRLTSADISEFSQAIYIEFLRKRSIQPSKEIDVVEYEPCWMDPIIQYLVLGTLPSEQSEARNLRAKAARFALVDGVLYKKSFSLPYLKCLSPKEADYALQEVHEGICGQHLGGRNLAHKILRQGYYWPGMQKDAISFM
ncbi:hypothetical protein RJ639_024172 [Escallonia herrerae]|uniref:Reverse transcriptase/retrotransposon-derived protein RNase H-like domain-containing protein n=1 Tax=Escallonia herrerae TaxID=1293975 RepID=A0AA89AED2_9ASTE|nr:hypothetical protein RJ639_024172 [Escallonia herrerae]